MLQANGFASVLFYLYTVTTRWWWTVWALWAPPSPSSSSLPSSGGYSTLEIVATSSEILLSTRVAGPGWIRGKDNNLDPTQKPNLDLTPKKPRIRIRKRNKIVPVQTLEKKSNISRFSIFLILTKNICKKNWFQQNEQLLHVLN